MLAKQLKGYTYFHWGSSKTGLCMCAQPPMHTLQAMVNLENRKNVVPRKYNALYVRYIIYGSRRSRTRDTVKLTVCVYPSVPVETAQRMRCDKNWQLLYHVLDLIRGFKLKLFSRVMARVKAVAVSSEPFIVSSARTKFLFKLWVSLALSAAIVTLSPP